jgi:hypothetical protein
MAEHRSHSKIFSAIMSSGREICEDFAITKLQTNKGRPKSPKTISAANEIQPKTSSRFLVADKTLLKSLKMISPTSKAPPLGFTKIRKRIEEDDLLLAVQSLDMQTNNKAHKNLPKITDFSQWRQEHFTEALKLINNSSASYSNKNVFLKILGTNFDEKRIA